jgi:hypothetical protein
VNVSLLIEAVVVDNDDVSEVRLVYNDVYNVDYNVTMVLTSGVLFGYVIPGQDKIGTVSFHVWVMDINKNTNSSITYSIDIFKPPVKDLILPHVIKTVPEHNATDVPINTLVKITFNETMDTSSTLAALSVIPPVNYSASWSNNDKILTITFAANLSFNQTYIIGVDIGAKDLANNPLKNKFQFHFRTELAPEIINDIDGDGMDDDWERDYGFDPTDPNDAYDDDDSDALINVREFEEGTDPFNADTDNDTLPDGWEVTYELDPLVDDAENDTDGDGYTNREEYQGGSKPNDANSIPVTKEPEEEEGGGLAVLVAVLVVIIIIVIIFMMLALKRHKVEEEEEESEGVREKKRKRESEDDWKDDVDREVGEDEEPLYADDNYCPECGWELGDDDLDCPDCGAEFAWEDEDDEEYDEE